MGWENRDVRVYIFDRNSYKTDVQENNYVPPRLEVFLIGARAVIRQGETQNTFIEKSRKALGYVTYNLLAAWTASLEKVLLQVVRIDHSSRRQAVTRAPRHRDQKKSRSFQDRPRCPEEDV